MGRKRIIDLYTLNDPEETLRFGTYFAKQIQPNTILALKGNLGAGKTTFVQGFLQGLSIHDHAQSPTFTYMQIYQGICPIYHFDLYRLQSSKDFISLGFEEYIHSHAISLIEWPEIIQSILPPQTILIELQHEKTGRTAKVSTWGK